MQNLASNNSAIGTIIKIGENTPEERFNARFFNKYLFEYFENLNSGTTGWGMCFNTWVEIVYGWKHIGFSEYEKILKMEE